MISYCAQSCNRCACTAGGNGTSQTPAASLSQTAGTAGTPASPSPAPSSAPASAPTSAPSAPGSPPAPASQQQLLQPLFQQLGGSAAAAGVTQPTGGTGQPTCQTDVLNFVR